MTKSPTLFQRLLLPGLAFKAVIIGGGYATGRELVEFFLPAGPWGGVLGMGLAMILWSLICTATFLFAMQTRSWDYRTFFQNLLGRGWPVFEASYILLILLILSVFCAAAGEIGKAVFGWPDLIGSLCLMAGILIFVSYGNKTVEFLFKYVSILLYGTYAVFLVLSLWRFGPLIVSNFAAAPLNSGWTLSGVTYASYNVVGAVMILPVLRHLTGKRDAIVAGLLCGPLAMAPALLFFVSIMAFQSSIGSESLPSHFLLQRLGWPLFELVFQAMIFAALLESSTGAIHAINQRIAEVMARKNKAMSLPLRIVVAAILLVFAFFFANRIGLIQLIGSGYRFLAWTFLAVFILPLGTYGVWRILRALKEPTADRAA